MNTSSRRKDPPPVWAILQGFGFVIDPTVFSDPPGGLRFDLGATALSASFCESLSGPIVLISGVYATSRRLAEIKIELPQKLDSPEFTAAYLSYRLDNVLGAEFESPQVVPWLDLGRRNQDLLPWEVSRVGYELHPHCLVRREWMKLAIRELRELLVEAQPDDVVRFHFDGEILRMDLGDRRVATPAEGRPWPTQFGVCAAELDGLPKRLRDPVCVDFRHNHLGIGRQLFPATSLEEPENGAAEGEASPAL